MHFLNIILHSDIILAHMVYKMGIWSYIFLFVIIFFERACILTPFLPGDSLLFAAGALAANSGLNIYGLLFLLSFASFSGVLINYYLGYQLRQSLYSKKPRWINLTYLNQAHVFFEKYGSWAMIACCFIPIIRTFVPFVAGMAEMNFKKYSLISLFSSCLWIIGLLCLSYRFGNMPFVKQHFSWFILAMIIIPIAIPFFTLFFRRFYKR